MIAPDQIYAVTGVLLFCLGFYGVISRAEALRKIMALNVLGAGVFLFFISVAWRNAGAFADAVPHAMVLTGIVVAVSATAFALGLARRISALERQEEPEEIPEEEDE